MKLKLFFLLLITGLLLLLVIAPSHTVFAATTAACPLGSTSAGCDPPTISDLQTFAVNLIGTAYALGGILFMLILIYNGAIYLIGSWEESKYILGASLEDVQKKMVQWGIGFFMFFLSYPFMNSILKFVVADSACYKDLQSPAVMLVFPTVCNYTKETIPNTTATPTPGTGTTTMTCDEFQKQTQTDLKQICTTNCDKIANPFGNNVFPGSNNKFSLGANAALGFNTIECYCEKSDPGIGAPILIYNCVNIL